MRSSIVLVFSVLVALVAATPAAAGGGPATGVAAGPAASAAVPAALLIGPTASVVDRPRTLTRQLRRALRAGDAGDRVAGSTTPRFEDLMDDGWGYPDDCGAATREVRHRICRFGDPRGSRTVVLLGASHATMWVPGLDPAARSGDTMIRGLFKFGCSPMVKTTWVNGEPWPECAAWREWALDRIAEIRPDAVIVAGHHYVNIEGRNGTLLRDGTPRYDRAFAAGMRKLGRRLAALTEDVVMMGDTVARPAMKRPTVCLEANDMRMGSCVSRLDRRTRAMNARDRRAARAVGARFVDPNRLICVERRCPVAGGGHFVYRDYSHVTRTWSKHVGPVLARRLGLNG